MIKNVFDHPEHNWKWTHLEMAFINNRTQAHHDYTRAVISERDALKAELKSHCACKFDGDTNTEQCKLHGAWCDTLHEQADYRRERDLAIQLGKSLEEQRDSLRKELAELKEAASMQQNNGAELLALRKELAELREAEQVGFITPLMEQQMFDDWCPYKGSPDPRTVWAAAIDSVNGLLLDAEPKSEPVQEPVAWMGYSPTKGNGYKVFLNKHLADAYSMDVTPLYAAPQDGLRKAAQMALEAIEFVLSAHGEQLTSAFEGCQNAILELRKELGHG